MIILPDCDLNRAVDGAIAGMRFTRQGQSCTASTRIFVHEKIFDGTLFLKKSFFLVVIISHIFLRICVCIEEENRQIENGKSSS